MKLYPTKTRKLPGLNALLAVVALAMLPGTAAAKSADGGHEGLKRYIIELQDAPLAMREELLRHSGPARAMTPGSAGHGRHPGLDLKSDLAADYLSSLAARHEAFDLEAAVLLGRKLEAVHRYRLATNGLAADLTAAEARLLEESALVRAVSADERYQLETYAGPRWIGAEYLWQGLDGLPQSDGEGIVVGVIDTGINWEHPSFSNPALTGYDHDNPLGQTVGLCSEFDVVCDGKLIGVWDFVEDDPITPDVVEENTRGRDNDGHGSLVASIAVGNRLNVPLAFGVNANLSGVAPRANVISYRVCFTGEPAGADTGGCSRSAILAAIEQAVEDGVDIINYSIGTVASDPWNGDSGVSQAFLGARNAGIFVVTSNGNSGPVEGSIGSPANAPWMMSVGYATHNSVLGSLVEDLAGGGSTPPGDLFGASETAGIGVRRIVHARDFGNALCGEGEAELQASCDDNLGLSNPWSGEQPFNGEIVVCDRGTYGRVEKGKNVLLAGAGGYILANTESQGGSIVADDHCLPATPIAHQEGERLRNWLASGSGHEGSISGTRLVEDDRFADQISASSSRGPTRFPAEDVLKPNLIAPGVFIMGASAEGQEFLALPGSSFSSPHLAGAGALLKAAHPDWSPDVIGSTLETTATAELATDQGGPTTPHQRGSGRPQIGEAARAGLALEVSGQAFANSNPSRGGDPRTLNLPGLMDANCPGRCGFTRTVTDLVGGASWTVTALDFPPAVMTSVNPSSFDLGDGQSRDIEINVDFSGTGIVKEWIFGRVRLSAPGLPDQFLTVAVYSDGGQLPSSWSLQTNSNSGWKGFGLAGLVGLPDATLQAGGLVKPALTTQVLISDPTPDDPYDGGEGVFTVWHSLPRGALWLTAETLVSTAFDLDLFVGRDDNGNGMAEEQEELCSSTSPDQFEQCNLYDLGPGEYWILVQNWEGNIETGDEATLRHAAVSVEADSNFAASAPGITSGITSFPVRLSWDNWAGLPGEEWLAAVGVGSRRETPNNLGVIPVRFTRTAIAGAETFPLMAGTAHALALDAGGAHDRAFIDVPAGAAQLNIFVSSPDANKNDGLTLELKRMDFDNALGDAPFASSPASLPVVIGVDGGGGQGPSVTVIDAEPGRWYAVLTNRNDTPTAVEIRAEIVHQGEAVSTRPGLWEPNSRPGLGQGYDFNGNGVNRAMVYYTYDEDGQPTWFIAGNVSTGGNVWTADLLRFTNDGEFQQSAPVGQVSVTALAEDDAMFSYTLFGQSGTERMKPISLPTCPGSAGEESSYTGLWYRGVDGLGGASVLVNEQTQGQIHYLYDDSGVARWLLAQVLDNPTPNDPELSMLQFHGYCAVCDPADVGFETVGVVARSFSNESSGNWTLDYLFEAPLIGSAQRTDSIVKLTERLSCQ